MPIMVYKTHLPGSYITVASIEGKKHCDLAITDKLLTRFKANQEVRTSGLHSRMGYLVVWTTRPAIWTGRTERANIIHLS